MGPRICGNKMASKGDRERKYVWQIECDLAWYVLLHTTVRVIAVIKILWTHEAATTNFDKTL